MSTSCTFARLFAVASLLLQLCSLVQLQSETISCSLGEAGFRNLTLSELIYYSDVVLAGRVSKTERGEFGDFNADVSYFFVWKSDAFVFKRLAYYTSVVGFSSPPVINQLNMFFLMRQPSSLKLSLLCMSNDLFLFTRETIDSIKQAGRNETMKISELGAVYPDPCKDPLSVCGSGQSCSALVSTVKGKNYRCVCLPGYHRNTTQQHCQPRSGMKSDLYCASCSYNSRCSTPPQSGQLECTCDHIQCEGTAQRSLCGSDGQTYERECDMILASCRQQISIHRLYYGRCRQALPAPCMGLGEPLNTSVGFVNCQGVSNSCPMHHFCHSVDGFYSVCCPVLHGKTTPTSPPPATPTPYLTSSPESPAVSPSAPTATPKIIQSKSGSGRGDGMSGDDESGDGASGDIMDNNPIDDDIDDGSGSGNGDNSINQGTKDSQNALSTI